MLRFLAGSDLEQIRCNFLFFFFISSHCFFFHSLPPVLIWFLKCRYWSFQQQEFQPLFSRILFLFCFVINYNPIKWFQIDKRLAEIISLNCQVHQLYPKDYNDESYTCLLLCGIKSLKAMENRKGKSIMNNAKEQPVRKK